MTTYIEMYWWVCALSGSCNAEDRYLGSTHKTSLRSAVDALQQNGSAQLRVLNKARGWNQHADCDKMVSDLINSSTIFARKLKKGTRKKQWIYA